VLVPGALVLVVAALIGLISGALLAGLLELAIASIALTGAFVWAGRRRTNALDAAARDPVEIALRSLSQPAVAVDAGGVIQRATQGVGALLGHELDDLVGSELEHIVAPGDWPALLELVRAAAPDPTLREWHFRHRDGWLVTIEGTLSVVPTGRRGRVTVLTMHDVTKWKALEEELTHQAFHDPLTGLPNRALYIDRLEHALRRRRHGASGAAVLFVDLDDFKNVNDSLGHVEGDALIAQVGQRLAGTIRAGDTAARLGGDEFALLLTDVDEDQAVALAVRVLDVLERPFQLTERSVRMGGSIGIAHSWAGLYDATDMLRAADIAMYLAKGAGKGQYRVFESSMYEAAHERLQLGADLAAAVERKEFVLHYQPTVTLPDGLLTGMEALIRWNHPTRGLLLPAEFITLAESTGLIIPIGEMVLRDACRQARAWQLARPGLPPLSMNVNLSGVQLEHPGLVASVSNALEDSELPAELLTLEITESVMTRETEATVRRLRQLKGLGVGLAIDDFGTGYASLSYLRGFPVDVVKIDKSFIDSITEGPAAAAFAQAIVRLAHALKTKTVAEGVETEAQVRRLTRMGCDQAQGFYFSKAMEENEATEYVVGHTTISFWLGHSGQELEVIKEVVADFEADNPDIRVNVVGDVVGERVLAALRHGRPPNVMASSESSHFGSYRSEGGLMDLAPWLARDGIGLDSFLAVTRVYTADGPKRWSLAMLADAYGLFWNRGQLAAAGLEGPPTTISQLTDYAKRLTQRNPDGSLRVVGFNPLFGFYENAVGIFGHMFGARWNDDLGQSSLASDPAWARMLAWQKELVEWYGYDHLVRFGREVGLEFSTANAFQTGRLAIVVDGGWRVAMIAAQAAGLDYGTSPVPVDDGRPDLYGSGYMNGTIIGIPAEATYKAESWRLVKYLATDDRALAKLSNGLRNVPSTLSALNSPDLVASEHFSVFLDISAHDGCTTTPMTTLGAQYQDVVLTFLEEWQAGTASDLHAGLRAVDRQIDAQLRQASRERLTVQGPGRARSELAAS
jgi:diguanylate cyclase (GGDEF)-like protein/PAS domain S-box-containing protein